MRTRASVIVVNWNGKQHLEHCLPALFEQSLAPHEIIVVDNNSTDDSLEYLALFPQVTIVSLATNCGFAGGNVAGLEATTGEYIVLLNNDTRPSPEWLERLVQCAASNDQVGIVASLLVDWDGEFIDAAGDACLVTGRGMKLQHKRPTQEAAAEHEVFSGCAGAVLYKRTMLDDVGFFDTRFFMNAEDTDLAFRAQLLGWRARYCAGAVVYHRISGSQGVYSDAAVFYASRNHLWLYAKCMPSTLAVKYIFSSVIHNFVFFAFFASRGQARHFISGQLAALRRLPEFMRERRNLQRRRRVSAKEIETRLTPLSRLIGEQMRRGYRRK